MTGLLSHGSRPAISLSILLAHGTWLLCSATHRGIGQLIPAVAFVTLRFTNSETCSSADNGPAECPHRRQDCMTTSFPSFVPVLMCDFRTSKVSTLPIKSLSSFSSSPPSSHFLQAMSRRILHTQLESWV
jgi:hypothetical protein